MSDPTFHDRHRWDLDAWPEMYGTLKELQVTIFVAEPGLELNLMAFTMASLTAGCVHCQAHGAYGLDGLGVDIDKITDMWAFEQSERYTDRERAALRFAMAAGAVPNAVGPSHHEDLRQHFSDAEARTLLGVVALSGFMNRYNDSLATVTDNASADWAEVHLSPLGWQRGKHAGADDERRPAPPFGDHTSST